MCSSVYNLASGQCFIGGVCYANGAANPANPCQFCNTAASTSTWTNRSPGFSCADGDWCDGDETCDGSGSCVPPGRNCSDGLACTTDSCSESLDRCEYTHNGASGQCWIGGAITGGGACYGNTAANPANVCQYCNTAAPTIWSNRAPGYSCSDGAWCNGDEACNGSGVCSPGSRSCADALGCTTESCNEGLDRCEQMHNAGSGQCWIGGTITGGGACHDNGVANPANACQYCSVGVPTNWSNRPPAHPCPDGLWCNGDESCNGSGACLPGSRNCADLLTCTTDTCNEGLDRCEYTHNAASGQCWIGGTITGSPPGTCYASGVQQPGNVCRYCEPGADPDDWSNRPLGFACDDGQYCTNPDTCNGSGVCQLPDRNCEDGLTCTSHTCDETANTCVQTTNATNCLISGVCYNNGQARPGTGSNMCQYCDAGMNQVSWTNRPGGYACMDATGATCEACGSGVQAGMCIVSRDCNDGLSCTSDTCSGTSTCSNTLLAGYCRIASQCYTNGQLNPANSCQSCQTGVSTSAWTNRADNINCGCGGGTSDICCGGTCVPASASPNCGQCGRSCTYGCSEVTNCAAATCCSGDSCSRLQWGCRFSTGMNDCL
jgi:hypothetical protein